MSFTASEVASVFRLEFVSQPEERFYRQECNDNYYMTVGVVVRVRRGKDDELLERVLEAVYNQRLSFKLCFENGAVVSSSLQLLEFKAGSGPVLTSFSEGMVAHVRVGGSKDKDYEKVKGKRVVLRVSFPEEKLGCWMSAPFSVLTKRKLVTMLMKSSEIKVREKVREEVTKRVSLEKGLCTRLNSDPAYSTVGAFRKPFAELFDLPPLIYPEMQNSYHQKVVNKTKKKRGNASKTATDKIAALERENRELKAENERLEKRLAEASAAAGGQSACRKRGAEELDLSTPMIKQEGACYMYSDTACSTPLGALPAKRHQVAMPLLSPDFVEDNESFDGSMMGSPAAGDVDVSDESSHFNQSANKNLNLVLCDHGGGGGGSLSSLVSHAPFGKHAEPISATALSRAGSLASHGSLCTDLGSFLFSQ